MISRIAITPGEPAGIGPDICLQVAQLDWPAQLIVIERAISENDSQTIQKEAHAIKGGAANLTAMRLSKTAHNLEMIGKSGELHQSESVFKTLSTEFETLKLFIAEL